MGDFPHAAGARTLFPQRTGGPTREETAGVSPFPSIHPGKARWGKERKPRKPWRGTRADMDTDDFPRPPFPQRTGGPTREETASASPFPSAYPGKRALGEGMEATEAVEGNTGRHGRRRFSVSPARSAPGDRHAKRRPAHRLSLPPTLVNARWGKGWKPRKPWRGTRADMAADDFPCPLPAAHRGTDTRRDGRRIAFPFRLP